MGIFCATERRPFTGDGAWEEAANTQKRCVGVRGARAQHLLQETGLQRRKSEQQKPQNETQTEQHNKHTHTHTHTQTLTQTRPQTQQKQTRTHTHAHKHAHTNARSKRRSKRHTRATSRNTQMRATVAAPKLGISQPGAPLNVRPGPGEGKERSDKVKQRRANRTTRPNDLR